MSLSELKIRNLKPKDKLYRVSDGDGLSIEVTPKGSKLWRWRYVRLGKPQMAALGKYPDVSLAQARAKRDDARDLVNSGKHVTREKKAQQFRQQLADDLSFEKVARHWLKRRELNAKYKKQTLARMEEYIFPVIGFLPIAEITIPDVVNAIERIIDHGTIETAKRMKQQVGQVFRYACQKGLCAQNPSGDLRDIFPRVEKGHHACIPVQELPDFLKKLNKRAPDLSKYAMQLLMLTFVRTGELIGARWEEIDWEKREWHIPKERMKLRRPHLVPIADQTLAILKKLHQLTGHHEFLFFSAASKSKHISNGTVLMALRRMKYQGEMTGHGFRTLASTVLNENGFRSEVIEKQLAHEERNKVRAAYNRAEYLEERREMMRWWADYCDVLGKGQLEFSDSEG